MKVSVKIISIAFLVFMVFFTVYQTALGGNPFFDEVHPVLLYGVFTAIAACLVVLAFRGGKKPKEEKK